MSYITIDSIHLTRMYQVASAIAIDGHNWLFPMEFEVIETRSRES